MARLVCEPYLIDPFPGGVHVVWVTDDGAGPHLAEVAGRRVAAESTPLEVLRADDGTPLPLRRHAARVEGLPPGRVPYRVRSGAAASAAYSLAGGVPPGGAVRLWLTSDHQLKPMVAANASAVAATVGVELDGVLFAGDLVNVPDRASDWFDRPRAFFRVLAGRDDSVLHGATHRGAPLLPHAPLFPAAGNHEVMGRRPGLTTLDDLFADPAPSAWDTAAYDALFGLPRWYARTIGDVFLVSLFVARAWLPDEETYSAADGQFVFEPVGRGTRQYAWLSSTLASAPARAARFRVVMFHHAAHGLGHHVVPPFTDPVRLDGRWSYPAGRDQLLTDLEPLLSEAGVHLVLSGHSHLWNRFRNAAGVHFLETSNVGNTYGAYVGRGDPGGLAPAVPPHASDEITAFSVLDSAAGTVRSWRFDTRTPRVPPELFDEFGLRDR